MPNFRAATIVVLAFCVAPLAASAQQTPRVYRVGVLASGGVDQTFVQPPSSSGFPWTSWSREVRS